MKKIFAGLMVVLCSVPSSRAAALGTAFAYQGRLSDGGNPVTGKYDLRFAIYDSQIGGSQLGNSVTNDDLSVSGGLVATEIDFGTNAFVGDARWLEISVRAGTNTGEFTPLNPRQPLLPVPYSLNAVTAYGLSSPTSAPIALRINGQPVFRLELTGASPNVIGGFPDNVVATGIVGATIAGGGQLGASNFVRGHFGTVGGGLLNTAHGEGAVGGGRGNTAHPGGTVAGGSGNVAALSGSVVGGRMNSAATESFVGGRHDNQAHGVKSVVGGGGGNRATGESSVVGGGEGNYVTGAYGVSGGGYQSRVEADFASVGGGWVNQAFGESSRVGGGSVNSAIGGFSFVGGGLGNQANGARSVAAGGWGNVAQGASSVVAGGGEGPGAANIAWGDHSSILGGSGNSAYAGTSAIGGGFWNTISTEAIGAVISGGRYNSSRAEYSVVPGGESNRVEGAYSLAAGRRAKAAHAGTFVWADSTDAEFTSTTTNQFAIRASGGSHSLLRCRHELRGRLAGRRWGVVVPE